MRDSMRLARRYRRLLWSYPRDYRRTRGEELLDTLLDSAPPGRTRPTPHEAVNLVRHGLRCRLGRPKSRSVVVWATLTAVIWGLFAAAVATRAAWETARPLPEPAETHALLAELFPEHRLGVASSAPALFLYYGEPLSWSAVAGAISSGGGEYEQASVGASALGSPPIEPREIVDRTLDRLDQGGWLVYEPVVRNDVDCFTDCASVNPVNETLIVARQGDTILTVSVFANSTARNGYLTASLTRAAPFAVHPAGIAAGLLGAAIAWLLFGWASRRSERRAAVTVLFGTAFTLWWLPVALIAPALATHHLTEPHPSWHPLWEWLGQPALGPAFTVGSSCALLALAATPLAHRRPDTTAQVHHQSTTPAT